MLDFVHAAAAAADVTDNDDTDDDDDNDDDDESDADAVTQMTACTASQATTTRACRPVSASRSASTVDRVIASVSSPTGQAAVAARRPVTLAEGGPRARAVLTHATVSWWRQDTPILLVSSVSGVVLVMVSASPVARVLDCVLQTTSCSSSSVFLVGRRILKTFIRPLNS